MPKAGKVLHNQFLKFNSFSIAKFPFFVLVYWLDIASVASQVQDARKKLQAGYTSDNVLDFS